MAYKVVYVEDLEADSVLHDLNGLGLNVEHCKPSSFIETINNIDEKQPNLILMDYRLMEGGGDVDAPSIAQFFRSRAIDDPTRSIPIVLLSNDKKIHSYLEDYTSHDLFDFAISKGVLSEKKEKYAQLIRELIESYSAIHKVSASKDSLKTLIAPPTSLEARVDPRIKETLDDKKYISNTYMASGFILNNIVKPIGILIGEDVLSARLGVSKSSKDWETLIGLLNEYQYKGIYSSTYKRWWSEGIEEWWNSQINKHSYLRTLSTHQKYTEIVNKITELELAEVSGDPKSVTNSFWTICNKSSIALDPSEGFEIKSELTQCPWLDSQYLTYESVRDHDLIDKLTDFEKSRYKELAKGK